MLTGREPRPSGREGLADVRVIEALYQSAAAGTPMRLGERRPGSHPKPGQLLERPPVREQELVRAAPPSGGNG